ncbi:hypothetical protein [Micromonospora sp. NPDC048843]|uniref:hypothetical protein n=1 Tax=Micromonospora TaxID=1873 RepID=UPI0033C7C4FB
MKRLVVDTRASSCYCRTRPWAADGRKALVQMNANRVVTGRFADKLHLVRTRFPDDELPLGGCDADELIFVFVDGQVAIRPYLVFAARTPASQHHDTEFPVGSILDTDLTPGPSRYDFHTRYQPGGNRTCGSCTRSGQCGKSCPAAVVASGGRIGDVDSKQCPSPNQAAAACFRSPPA